MVSLSNHVPRNLQPAPVLVGFSGGLDSTVLLHLLHAAPETRRHGLRALHVHHGLHADADHWAAHCQQLCDTLGIPLTIVHAQVACDSGLGPEGSARNARLAAFAQTLRDGEILALAQHQDDQAETFLLRALRGSSVDGLGAMRAWRKFAHGWLWRPLLGQSRASLHAYAVAQQFSWIEDPSNASSDFDRNFLRHQILPMLRQRWPQAGENFARSAALCTQARDLLDAEDSAVLASVRSDPHTLAIDILLAFPEARRARLLRRWISALELPPLPANGIHCIEHELLPAPNDAQARFDWAGARVQRWCGLLHADLIRAPLATEFAQDWDGAQPLMLPSGDVLTLVGAACFERTLRVKARQGGERIALPRRNHSHALKHVLQHAGIPPWLRERLPLLFDGETLLAAGDAIVSAQMQTWLDTHDAELEWLPV